MPSPLPPSEGEMLAIVRGVFARHARVTADVAAEERFLHLLLPGAQSVGNVRNSFRGIWRLNAFMDDLQEAAGVCLGLGDDEKEWTQRALAEHILRKKANPSAQRVLLEKRQRQARQYLIDGAVKSFLFLTLPLGIFFWYVFSGDYARMTGLFIAAMPSLVVVWLCAGDVFLYRRLSGKIGASGGRKHDG